MITSKNIEAIILNWIADHFGDSEADDPCYNIELLAEHIAERLNHA